MYIIYLWNGQYIQGDKVGEAKTPKEAWEIAKGFLTEAGFRSPFKKKKDKTDIWLDDCNGSPIGVIVQTEETKE